MSGMRDDLSPAVEQLRCASASPNAGRNRDPETKTIFCIANQIIWRGAMKARLSWLPRVM